ncbi:MULTISPECIES: hypothetical protein [Candidatus Ichthyocystis]|uniref:Uncharacterized protein n=1 Tax=Candidatus Ichthyocystis hellenicum TaxID=1561003 RepID=A0A0S4M600_9BURK|nr:MULTISPECIES: hypothetical protein [Ichthyocystis]CUT17686.1 hypothetical protein Ark11_0863 [Candidatus Ichthyocystis hellenicum]
MINSKNIFPIFQEALRCIVDEERAELYDFLIYVVILDGDGIRKRKFSPYESGNVLGIYTNRLNRKNVNLYIRIWMNLFRSRKVIISKDVDFDYDKSALMFPVDGKSDLLVDTMLESECPVVTSVPMDLLSKRDKIINMWGLSLHPDDDKLILFVRIKYSLQIKEHLAELFSGILRRRIELPSGVVPRYSSWSVISGDLSEIAIQSIGAIIKNQYEELDRFLSRARLVEVNESDTSSCTIRMVTEDEKSNLMARVKNIINKRLKAIIRLSWLSVVNKSSEDVGYGYKDSSNIISRRVTDGSWGVKLCRAHNIAILSTRKKFSSIIKGIVYNKFSNMLKNRYKFDDNTFVCSCAWFRISRKLVPIAKEEVKHIIEEESIELEKIISMSRVVIDCGVDREITKEEASIVFKNVMNLVHKAFSTLLRRIWGSVVNYECDSVSDLNFTDEFPLPVKASLPVKVMDCGGVAAINKSHNFKINLYHEDDAAILNIRNQFSRKMNRLISDKYSEMIAERHKFDDATVASVRSWKEISKKLLPIFKKEIAPIIESERIKINDVLLKARVNVFSSDCSFVTARELTSAERFTFLGALMKSVRKQAMRNLCRIWNKVIKLPSLGLRDIKEVCKSDLDFIKLEFIGNLGQIVDEVVGSLSSDVDMSLSGLEDISFSAYNIVYERSTVLFKEGGFLGKVELLLSDTQVVDEYGCERNITDEESNYLIKEFISTVYSDIDCLVKKRIAELRRVWLPDCQNKYDISKIAYVENLYGDDHSYCKKGISS